MTFALGIALLGIVLVLVGAMRWWLTRPRSGRTYRRLPLAFWPTVVLVLVLAIAVHGHDLRIVLGGAFWLLLIAGWAWERSA